MRLAGLAVSVVLGATWIAACGDSSDGDAGETNAGSGGSDPSAGSSGAAGQSSGGSAGASSGGASSGAGERSTGGTSSGASGGPAGSAGVSSGGGGAGADSGGAAGDAMGGRTGGTSGAAGDGGSGGDIPCGSTSCPPSACCRMDQACGLTVATGTCVTPEPGEPDENCPGYNAGEIVWIGCCLESGQCGYFLGGGQCIPGDQIGGGEPEACPS